MNRSENWEDERYIFEKLKQTTVFRNWKKAQFDCQRGRCAYCEKPMMYNQTETDHILPLYYGGTSEAKNMVICCHSCNETKSTMVGFVRPEWIVRNPYDLGVDEKYRVMRESLKNGPLFEIINNDADDYITKPKVKKRSYDWRYTRLVFCLIWIFIIIVTFCQIAANNSMQSKTTRSTYSNSSNVTNKSVQSKSIGNAKLQSSKANVASSSDAETDSDSYRQRFAQYVLAEYTAYYNYWVVKKGYDLPHDASICRSWNGCNLSFPLGKVRTPDGYTYSINTIANGVTFVQNGQIPHALKDNVAIYKRARCGVNGAVIGGSEGKNAAAVIQLSNGSYYCVEN